MVFEKLEARYRIAGKIYALTPLHIGSGREGALGSVDLPILVTAEGRPYIPGSSLKGVTRSYAERILRGATGNGQQFGKVEALVRSTFGYSEGENSQASKVIFRDCFPVEAQKDYRWSVAIDRKTKKAAEHKLFSCEFVSPGAVFSVEMVGDNLSEPEVGILCVGLRPLIEGHGSVGGGKSRGMGKIELRIERVERISPLHYLYADQAKGVEAIPWSEFERKGLEALRKELGIE